MVSGDTGVSRVELIGEQAMVAFGHQLGLASAGEATIFLRGNLGMGKTTLCRGVLQAYGHSGAVKSPTYTLVEPYDLSGSLVYHFDLYRLADAEELEYLGIRDYFSEPAVRLIEWPERGLGVLPDADLLVDISIKDAGRALICRSQTDRGTQILRRLAADKVATTAE